jgi:hypothetical protein
MEYREVSDAFASARGVLDWIEEKVNRGFVKRLYAMKLRVKWYTPPVLIGKTQEIDDPYRESWSVFFHVLPKTMVGFGLWSKTGLPEHEALLKAVRGGLEVSKKDMEHFDVDAIQGEYQVVDGVGGFKPRGLRDGTARDAGIE